MAQLRKLGMFKSNISNFEIERHRYLVWFLTIFYVKPWIQCPLPFEVTVYDLGFFPPTQKRARANQIFLRFFDGFITAALNRLDAHQWYLSEEMAFFSKLKCQRKRSIQKRNVAIETEIQSCSSKIRQSGDTRAQKVYKKNPYLNQIRF